MMNIFVLCVVCGLTAAEPSIRTSSGGIFVNVDQAAGADFGVTDSSTGNVETWSDLKSSIAGVGAATEANSAATEANTAAIDSATDAHGLLDDRTDQVETLLGLARRQDESDPASLPDLIASLVEVNELVAPLLQASINQTRDSGAAVVSAIRAANVATVAGLSPPEVSVAGGEMISVGGRGFIPGLDGLYKCQWSYSSRAGSITLTSNGTAAQNQNLLSCAAPAWPHPPAIHIYSATFVLLEGDSPVVSTSEEPLVTRFAAQAPTMTPFSLDYGNDGISVAMRAIANNNYVFYIEVDDVDGQADHVTLSGTSDNTSFVRSVAATSSGSNRTVVLGLAAECGISNLTFLVVDRLGLNRTQTFPFEVRCPSSWIRLFRTTTGRHSNMGTFQNPRWTSDSDAGFEDPNSDYQGMFNALRTLRGITHIRILKLTGPDGRSSGNSAGEEAIYRLIRPLSSPLWQTMQGCGCTNGAHSYSPETTSWTNQYSGRKIAGSLRGVNRNNNPMQIPYFFICGVNTCGDDDSSFMAFSDAVGHNGCRWSDHWRGNNQKGTVWSAWSDDFTTDRGRICTSPQSFPGYKHPGGRSYNRGIYEIYGTNEYAGE